MAASSLLYQKRVQRSAVSIGEDFYSRYDQETQLNLMLVDGKEIPLVQDPIILGTRSKSKQAPSDDDPDAFGGDLY